MKYESIFSVVAKFLSYRLINLLFPFLSISLISNKLTINDLGIFFLCLVLSAWITLLVDFGFIRHAVVKYKEVCCEDRSEYFSNILVAQLFLSLISLVLGIIFYFFYMEKLNVSNYIFFMVYGVFNGLVPKWYFQANSCMHKLAIIETVIRVVLFIGLFWLLSLSSSFHYVEICYSLISIFSFIISLLYLRYDGVNFKISNLSVLKIRRNLKDSLGIFYSRFAGNVYLNLNILVIGHFLTPKEIAVYGIAEKVVKAMSNILTTFSEATFPLMAKNKDLSHNSFLIKNSLIAFAISILPCLGLYLFSIPIYKVLFNTDARYAYVLDIMAWSPLLYSVSSVLALHGLIAKRKYMIEFYCQLIVAFFGFITLCMSIYIYGIVGAAYSYILIAFLSVLLLILANMILNSCKYQT